MKSYCAGKYQCCAENVKCDSCACDNLVLDRIYIYTCAMAITADAIRSEQMQLTSNLNRKVCHRARKRENPRPSRFKALFRDFFRQSSTHPSFPSNAYRLRLDIYSAIVFRRIRSISLSWGLCVSTLASFHKHAVQRALHLARIHT